MGVVVWPMIELEADDALASAAYLAAKDKDVDKVCIWTPDKDLGQCVVGEHVVQIDGRRNIIRNEQVVREKFGVGS
jgi:5'-3' exonuclease